MRQPSEEGSYSHEKAAHSNESGPVQLGPKMADHSKKQQVAYLQKKSQQSRRNAYIRHFKLYIYHKL